MSFEQRTRPVLTAALIAVSLLMLLGCVAPPPDTGWPSPAAIEPVAEGSTLAGPAAEEPIDTRVAPPKGTAPAGATLPVEPTPTQLPVPTSTPTLTQSDAALSKGSSAVTPGSLSTPTALAATATRTPIPTPGPTSVPPTVVAKPAPGAPPTPQQPADGPRANTSLFKQQASGIPLSISQGVASSGDVVLLGKQPNGTFAAKSLLFSKQQTTAFPFNNAVLSWNADAPPGTLLEFQMRVGRGDTVSPWFTMGTWGSSGGSSVGGQVNAWGEVDVDTLELAGAATTFQYRVSLSTENPAASPRVRSVAVAFADLSRPLAGPRPAVAGGWVRDIPVPQYSQLEQDPSVARAICSPTSLAMVLNYWGKGKPVKEVYSGVRDARTGIFGNWPLNTAFVGALDFDAHVDRFYSIEQLQNEIAQGRPAIISIRFGPGQLDNSPIDSTTGHLIVVRGFTPQGDVIVNDPIAPSSGTVRRVYKRDQLAKVWLDSGGVAYIVRPR